jgi:hypothetical protein
MHTFLKISLSFEADHENEYAQKFIFCEFLNSIKNRKFQRNFEISKALGNV